MAWAAWVHPRRWVAARSSHDGQTTQSQVHSPSSHIAVMWRVYSVRSRMWGWLLIVLVLSRVVCQRTDRYLSVYAVRLPMSRDIGQDRRTVIRTGPSRVLVRSEGNTSELQSLMRISYAVFCLKKRTNNKH